MPGKIVVIQCNREEMKKIAKKFKKKNLPRPMQKQRRKKNKK